MGCVRTWWTRARQRRQWALMAMAALAVGCCGVGGTVGSEVGSLGRAVESRAWVRRGQGTALKWLTAGAQAQMQGTRGAQGRGGAGGNMNGMKMRPPPPPPPQSIASFSFTNSCNLWTFGFSAFGSIKQTSSVP